MVAVALSYIPIRNKTATFWSSMPFLAPRYIHELRKRSKRKGDFARYASKRKDVDPNGWYDVIAHGSPEAIEVNSLHGETLINSRQAAAIIRKQPGFKKAKGIRLLSCSTGLNPEGFTQHLANALGKPVSTPTHTLYADWYGNMWVGGNGRFTTYYPGGIKHGKE